MENAQLTLGIAEDLASTYGGYVNRKIPILVDTQYYGKYRIKLTTTLPRVDEVTARSQIAIFDTPNKTVLTDANGDPLDFTPNKQILLAEYGASIKNHLTLEEGSWFGIGKAPGHALDMVGNAYIDGEINTKKITVTLDGWADHVFDENHRLMPLESVADFIAANGHLPGVPSAEEVAERGVDLGRMQATLLEKIEEMTLHMIALKRENESLLQQFNQCEIRQQP